MSPGLKRILSLLLLLLALAAGYLFGSLLLPALLGRRQAGIQAPPPREERLEIERPASAEKPPAGAGSDRGNMQPEPERAQTGKIGQPALPPAGREPAVAEERPPKRDVFAIQAGSFAGRDNAAGLADELKKQGHAVRIVSEGKDFKVLVGNYTDHRKAQEQKEKFVKEGRPAFVRSIAADSEQTQKRP